MKKSLITLGPDCIYSSYESLSVALRLPIKFKCNLTKISDVWKIPRFPLWEPSIGYQNVLILAIPNLYVILLTDPLSFRKI